MLFVPFGGAVRQFVRGVGAQEEKPLNWKDATFFWFNLIAVILICVCLLPAIDWRYTKEFGGSAGFGTRFTVARRIGMLTSSNQYERRIAWFKMKSLMCAKSEELFNPSVTTMAFGIASQIVSHLSKESANVTVGGPMLGCVGWSICREHVADRCLAYRQLAPLGIASFFLIVAGAISATLAVLYMRHESRHKKKKKREEAEWNTEMASVIAVVLTTLGTMLWLGITSMSFMELQMKAFYPFPRMSAGGVVVLIADGLLIVSAFVGSFRLSASREEASDEERQPFGSDAFMEHQPFGAPSPAEARLTGWYRGQPLALMGQNMGMPQQPPSMGAMPLDGGGIPPRFGVADTYGAPVPGGAAAYNQPPLPRPGVNMPMPQTDQAQGGGFGLPPTQTTQFGGGRGDGFPWSVPKPPTL
mmetsp:Transcript_74494/g.206914  ORF Transcript_74494/g.206914 Transcript_74494/m.206914 type:complete len:415 (+) Transcript_74494:169-1413(+)